MKDFIGILKDVLMEKRYSTAAIPSLHLVTAVLASNWISKENYFELIKMYVLLAVAAICYQSLWKRDENKDRKFIDEIVFDVNSHIRSFVTDLKENYQNVPLLNKHIFAEWSYFHPRKMMIAGLVSALLLDKELKFDDETEEFLQNFVRKTKHMRFLVWEGIIPYCLAEFWTLSNIQGTVRPDIKLIGITKKIINCNNKDEDSEHLAGPYYSLEEVVRRQYKGFLQEFRSFIDRDNHYRRAWFAEPLFMLIARRNYKRSCQDLWPDLTRFIHCRTLLPTESAFGPVPCEDAIAQDILIDTATQKTWAALILDAVKPHVPAIPKQLLSRPALVLLYCLFMPQRMDREVILWLDRQFCKSWY